MKASIHDSDSTSTSQQSHPSPKLELRTTGLQSDKKYPGEIVRLVFRYAEFAENSIQYVWQETENEDMEFRKFVRVYKIKLEIFSVGIIFLVIKVEEIIKGNRTVELRIEFNKLSTIKGQEEEKKERAKDSE